MKRIKKNIILIGVIILNFIIIGFTIYQNNYINTKFKEIDKKLENLSSSNNQQDIQINQLTEKQRKTEQQETLKNSETETDESIFENTPTDGLTPITADEAKKIWKQYLNDKQKIFAYTITGISIEQKKPNNFLDIQSIDTYGYKMADFTRKCYVIVCTLNKEEFYIKHYFNNI